jgi:multidrug efflux pump subunit AcrB
MPVYLGRLLKHRYLAILSLVGIGLVILIIAIGTLDVVLFPNQEFDTLILKTESPISARIEQTEIIISEPEKILLNLSAGKSIIAFGLLP